MISNSEKIFSVVVAYNDISGLKRCIRGLCEQTKQIHTIIIVDNSLSSLPSVLIEHLHESHKNKILYLRCPHNLGSAGGFSLGMSKAYQEGAQWIWLHDEDDYPERNCLKKLLCQNDGMIRAPQIVDPKTGKILRYFKRVQGCLGYFYPAPRDKVYVDVAGTAGLLIHRDVIARIGVYDPDFFIGYEDYEYCLRARIAGLTVHVVTEAMVFHPDHQSPTFSRYYYLDRILAYLPSFWGIISKGSSRDVYAIRNYIIVSKRYKPNLIICLEMLLSLCMLPILKVFNPRISLRMTFKTYLKALYAT
jgi:rhamnopyranosyl-N-acetylglucosaminyl-diphospho-decaprenol beta-1,3/1,4-galactofuranosyltransferase